MTVDNKNKSVDRNFDENIGCEIVGAIIWFIYGVIGNVGTRIVTKSFDENIGCDVIRPSYGLYMIQLDIMKIMCCGLSHATV